MQRLKYDYNFDPEEQNNTAAAVASFALAGGPEVLDIGSGPGWVSRYLAGEHDRTVTCLDYDADALSALEEAGLRAHFTDLETDEWDAAIEGESFDVVILADVLEHLRRPDLVLDRLREKGILREDGHLVISVPNASHQSVLSELLVGDFRYTETGILDETHLRWFTLTSLQRLLERSGYVVEKVHRTTRILENLISRDRAAKVEAELRSRMVELNQETWTYQFVVLARPRSYAGELAQRADEHERETRELWDSRERMRGEVKRAEAELERAHRLLAEERAYFRSELKAGAAEVAAMREEMEEVRGRNRSIQRQLDKWRREYNQLVDPDGTPITTRVYYRRAKRIAKRQLRRDPRVERMARQVRDKLKGGS